MMAPPKFIKRLRESEDISLVGGKAANLGSLVRAGFPVPDGFVVTTLAYLHARSQDQPAEVTEEIRAAYRMLGAPMVAVRSSATAEDMTGASMAGQYVTFLYIQGEEALLDAVRRCWESVDTPRVKAYLREHAIDPSRVAMAVVVQRLVPADVAGVLFTTNPQDGWHHEMLLEASWGLGETVVSGRVQPDVLRLDQDTGRVLAASIVDKKVQLAVGGADLRPVDEAHRRQPCLSGRDVNRLWEMGRRVAGHFGRPMDIEWAIHSGKVYLLQSRPITTLQDAEVCEEIVHASQHHLRQELAAGRGPWVLHNLAETLPHPTPLTWAVMKRFMSGLGGFGTLYRQAGFKPSPVADRDGFLECIAGRIYLDAARAPEMLFKDFPYAYNLDELRQNPDASQTPPTLPHGSLVSRWKAGRRLKAVYANLDTLSTGLEYELREGLFKEIAAYVAWAKTQDLPALSLDQLRELWLEHERRVLDVFGPRLLMPAMICGKAMGDLRTFLQEGLWDEEEDAEALSRLISSGGEPDRTVMADAGLYEVGKGKRPIWVWLTEHGHRAAGEFDLAAPRWREQPEAVQGMADRLAKGDGPLERHRRHVEEVNLQIAAIRSRLASADRPEFDRRVSLAQRYVVLREDSKDLLMLGYDLLRDLALEAGRRLDMGQDVFYLTREEFLDSLRIGFAPYHQIEQRKKTFQAEARLTLPRVIDAKAIDSLGDLPDVKPWSGGHKAFAVSAGEASGPARILRSPTEAGALGQGYVLVCPSTDPSWTPLFVNAAGLVLECGGTLSHGAVVAREMGLPAVVLPDATRLFQEGQEIRVDGQHGWVGPVAGPAVQQSLGEAIDPDDTSIPRNLIPPPVGRRDQRAARLAAILAMIWAVYLIAFFVLPQQWVRQPTLHAQDVILWPIARTLGRPAVVAIIAIGVAVLTLLIQRLVPDNRRLLEAKQRAAAIRRQADSLPKGSRRQAALTRLATEVQVRTMIASMVPIGVLLGPMVIPFVWFQERIDPAVWNAPAGSNVQVVAIVDSNWTEPIRIDVPQPFMVDDSTPQSRTLPPIRPTLERLLALYRQPRSDPNGPWELQYTPDLGREQTANDLQAYLDAGIPPQGITWLIRPPEAMNGRFTVTVTADGHPSVKVDVVIGDTYPPAPARVKGPAGSPVKEVRVVYPKPKFEPVFWKPLASLAGHDRLPWATRLATIDIGWLWLYILVYLPALFLTRAILKVA